MNWDEYFIGLADVISKKSKDSSTKVGCVIVDENHRVVSTGYNGSIQGSDESFFDMDKRPDKYYYVIHAEMNALLFAKQDLSKCILYTKYAPCSNCLKHILQAGIREIVYENTFVESKNNAEITLEEKSIHNMIFASHCLIRNINGNTWLKEVFGYK